MIFILKIEISGKGMGNILGGVSSRSGSRSQVIGVWLYSHEKILWIHVTVEAVGDLL